LLLFLVPWFLRVGSVRAVLLAVASGC
jgi:hypothetical protein